MNLRRPTKFALPWLAAGIIATSWAARPARAAPPPSAPTPQTHAPHARPSQPRSQGACPAAALAWQQVAPQAWWLPGAGGDSNAENRGEVINHFVVRWRGQVWLLGSGPSPVAAQALRCQLRRQLGWRVSDVINPWARPEQVLGNAGFAGARLWAHAEVAALMHSRCPHCEERLRQRLGPAEADLGAAPIRWPTRLVSGDAGQLGPFDWWRLQRGPEAPTLLLHLRGSALWLAPGLLWADGPPDLRDADPAALLASTERLMALAAQAKAAGPAPRFLPEEGAWLSADAPAEQIRYLNQLAQAVRAQQAAGALEAAPPPPLPGVAAWLQQGRRVSLNWQRAWRLLEGASFDEARPAATPGTDTLGTSSK